MTDLISRADAIEAVRKKLQDWGGYAFEDYRRGLYEAQDILEALPSVDAVSLTGTMKYLTKPHNYCEVVRCKDCRYANECHKSVQYTRHESSTVIIGYSPIEWCSRGERREP